ncbi:MAG: restriction endonuclease subunit S [Bacteroidota bacterium]
MKFGLEQHIIDKLIAVFEQHSKVDKALVFGSRAKGNYRNDSDIDIAIKGQDLNTDDIIAMSVAFEEKGITHKIDLINYETIKEPDLKDHINRVGIELYSRWKDVNLGDVVKFGNGKERPKIEGEIPVYGGNGILGYTNQSNYDGEVLIIGRVGAYCGSVYYENRPIWISDNALSAKPKNNYNAKFLYYFLKNLRLNNQAQGSSHPLVTQTLLNSIEVALPDDIQEQTAIANILTSLDDKINLLHRQNKTLEGLAETLFRSYFPMTNEGNKYVELGHYVECINGVSYKSSELNPSKVGMVSLKSFDRNGGFSIDGFKEFTGKFKEKQEVVEGDLIVAHTDITQDAEVIGNPALVISNPNFETMTISMDIVKVISKVDWISIEFLYFLMRTREFKSHCEGCANGSTVLHLNKQAIPTFEFPEPDKTKVADFTKQVREIVSKEFLNHRQLRNLVKTRDTLLPKLMSGEVRVNL